MFNYDEKGIVDISEPPEDMNMFDESFESTIKKNHDDTECWNYGKPYGHVQPMYMIDGLRRTEHMSAQYLMDTYGMNIGEAYKYVNDISRHG